MEKKMFLGYSSDDYATSMEIAACITGAGKPLVLLDWQSKKFHDIFSGAELFTKLINTANSEVVAALFIFGENIKINESEILISSNVLIEYGLFVGVLGLDKVRICKIGKPKLPSDLGGVLYYDTANKADVFSKLINWAKCIAEECEKKDINQKSNVNFTDKEILIIKHLKDRKNSHGYTTKSYLSAYCYDKGLEKIETANFLNRLNKHDIIREELILDKTVFFLTEKGFSIATQNTAFNCKELVWKNQELEIND